MVDVYNSLEDVDLSKIIKDLFIAMERIEIIADAAEGAYEKKPEDIERENAEEEAVEKRMVRKG